MRLVYNVFSVFLLLSFTVALKAQVTIGSNKPPVQGALLQLKENENIDVNSTKGLLLPRVQLNGHNLDSITKTESDTPEMYTGLTVWNIRGVEDICKGVNTWVGDRWESAMPKPEDYTNYNSSLKILTDHEGNTYSTGEFGIAGIWMTENLRTTRAPGSCDDVFFPGELSSDDFNNRMELKIMMYPNGSVSSPNTEVPSTWKKEQGMLYSWALATNGKGDIDGNGNVDGVMEEEINQPVQRQGICPTGWHLPSIAEWKELYLVLQADATNNTDAYANYAGQPNTVTTRGGSITARSNIRLNNKPTLNGASKPAKNGGFDALLVGTKTATAIAQYGVETIFWTASSSSQIDSSNNTAMSHGIILRDPNINLTNATENTVDTGLTTRAKRTSLFSVRCKKN